MRKVVVVAVLRAGAVLVVSGALVAPAAAQKSQYYVLDGLGGVHAGGGAPAITPATPYFGFDVATDLVFVPKGQGGATGDSLLVLDAFGGVHAGGALRGNPPTPKTPYFGFNIARAIAYRDVPPRVNAGFETGAQTVTSGAYVAIASTSINAPDDGFLLVVANAQMGCAGTGASVAMVSLGLDSLTGVPGLDYDPGVADCGSVDEPEMIGLNYVFRVTAGNHAIHLLALDRGAAEDPIFSERVISVLYIPQNTAGST